jgi:HEAT repeat protein
LLRLRIERKLRKSLRRFQHEEMGRRLARAANRYERNGLPLGNALQKIVIDAAAGVNVRSLAGRILAISDYRTAAELLAQFFLHEGKVDLWETALTLERLGDVRAVGHLIPALNDPNHDRHHAAARALGWISAKPGNRVVDALIKALTDVSQPLAVREEAAESLAYLGSSRAIPALISVLADSDSRIRFWAVFALGKIGNRRTFRHADRSVVPALESMLSDQAAPPGNWWSVAREALAMLWNLNPPEIRHRDRLIREIERVTKDPDASPEDRRWAGFYCSHGLPRSPLQ